MANKSYFSFEVGKYAEQLTKQKELWAEESLTDEDRFEEEKKGITNPVVHTAALLAIVNKFGSIDSHDGAMAALMDDDYLPYMVEGFKGRGDFTTHFINTLKAFDAASRFIGKMDGYTLELYDQAWELRKGA